MQYKTLEILILIAFAATHIDATKWLVSSPDFNSIDAWEDENLPCPNDEVVFPSNYAAILSLPKEVDISGFILPHDGALLLNQNSIINIDGDGDSSRVHGRRCHRGERDNAYLKIPPIKKWFDPESWRSMTENAAFPNMERVPCNNDTVVINGGSLAIDMEDVPYLRVGEFNLAGSVLSRNYLQQLLSHNDIGSILFHNTAATAAEFYRNDVCGCQKDIEHFFEPICHNVMPTCKRPHCLSPLQPFGSCCPTCGALLLFRFASTTCDDKKFQMLHNLIEKQVHEQRLTDDIDFHVAYINTQKLGNILQAFVVDRDGYDRQSVHFVAALNASTNWSKFFKSQVNDLSIEFAGRPYNPNVTFGSIVLCFLCAIFVGLVALIIFAHYAPNHPYLNLLPQRWRTLIQRSPFVFARFDNFTTGNDDGGASTPHDDHLTIRYRECADSFGQRSFDNPLFEQGIETVTTTMSTAPATTSPSLPSSLSSSSQPSSSTGDKNPSMDFQRSSNRIVGNDDDGDKQVQNLTEIKLEAMAFKNNRGADDNDDHSSGEEIETT